MGKFDFDLPTETSKQLTELASEVSRFATPKPTKWQMSFADIYVSDDRQLVEKMPAELNGKTKSIYVFRIVDGANNADVGAAFNTAKNAKDGRSYARFLGGNSDCLYVGSCYKTATMSRLKQHFGLSKSASTYAMQIRNWANGLNGGVEISVYSYHGREISSEVLQALEDCLHSKLKPILGKKGGK